MAVLVEGISVIILSDRIDSAVAGGWNSFKLKVANSTLCSDGEIVRVGFMHPDDAQSFVCSIQTLGLRHLEEGQAIDIVVADQIRGLMTPCDWALFGHISWRGDPKHRVGACMLRGSELKQIATPEDWEFDTSLTSSYCFIPVGTERLSRNLASNGGFETWQSPLSDNALYAGRTT